MVNAATGVEIVISLNHNRGVNFVIVCSLLFSLFTFLPWLHIVLWPLFHYILWDEATDGRVEKRNWEDYVFVNQQFADAIVEQYQPGDIGRSLFFFFFSLRSADLAWVYPCTQANTRVCCPPTKLCRA